MYQKVLGIIPVFKSFSLKIFKIIETPYFLKFCQLYAQFIII